MIMHRYYRYVFIFGHGKKKIDLPGRGVEAFWNDIYDLFDLYRKLKVEKLNGTDFKTYEVRRLFKSIEEDMAEDIVELDIVIKPNCLEFFNLGEFGIFDCESIERGIRKVLLVDDLRSMHSGRNFNILRSDKLKVFFIILLEDNNETKEVELSKKELEIVLNQIGDRDGFKIHIITDLDLSADAEDYIRYNKIEAETSCELLRKINLMNLQNAIRKYEMVLKDRVIGEFQIKYPDRINDKRYKDLKYCIFKFNGASLEKRNRLRCWYDIIERVLGSKVRNQIIAVSGVTEKDIKNAKKIMNACPVYGSRHEGKMAKLRHASKDEIDFCLKVIEKFIAGWIKMSGIND